MYLSKTLLAVSKSPHLTSRWPLAQVTRLAGCWTAYSRVWSPTTLARSFGSPPLAGPPQNMLLLAAAGPANRPRASTSQGSWTEVVGIAVSILDPADRWKTA